MGMFDKLFKKQEMPTSEEVGIMENAEFFTLDKIKEVLHKKNPSLLFKLEAWMNNGYEIKDYQKFIKSFEKNKNQDLVSIPETKEIIWGDHGRWGNVN
jgi:hypothetical protein